MPKWTPNETGNRSLLPESQDFPSELDDYDGEAEEEMDFPSEAIFEQLTEMPVARPRYGVRKLRRKHVVVFFGLSATVYLAGLVMSSEDFGASTAGGAGASAQDSSSGGGLVSLVEEAGDCADISSNLRRYGKSCEWYRTTQVLTTFGAKPYGSYSYCELATASRRRTWGGWVKDSCKKTCGLCPPKAPPADQLLAQLKLDNVCTGQQQTSFPFTWDTITALRIIDDTDSSTYQSDLTAYSVLRGSETDWWDYRNGGGWLTFKETNLGQGMVRLIKTNLPIRASCTFKFPLGKTYTVKVRGNPNDFASFDELKKAIEPYLFSLGRVPEMMFENMKRLTVNGAGQGGNIGGAAWMGDMTINLGQDMAQLGDSMFQEGTHISLDSLTTSPQWVHAVKADCNHYFSSYAQQNQLTEGVAESLLLYWALRYRPDRLTQEQKDNVIAVGSHRMKFFHDHVVNGKLHLAPRT